MPAKSAMLIVCPNCATSYRVIPEYLGDSGRSVRCVTCHHVWFEEPHNPGLEPEGALDDAWPPLQPYSQSLGPLNEAVDIDSRYYSQSGHEATGYEPGQAGDPDQSGATPWLAESEIAEFAPAPSISPGGTEHGNPLLDIEPELKRLAARRRFRRAKPVRRPAVRARSAMPAVICVLILTLAASLPPASRSCVICRRRRRSTACSGCRSICAACNSTTSRPSARLQDGVPVLVVEGDIVGTGARVTEVPRLRFAVIDRAGKEIYAWTARPDRTLLPLGETLPFRSRLASPPAEAHRHHGSFLRPAR